MELNKTERIVFNSFSELNKWLKQNNGRNVGYYVLENNDGTTTYMGLISGGLVGLNYNGILSIN